MTKQELLEKLHAAHTEFDQEGGHVYADRALIEYINDEDVKKAYEEIPKWYA